MSDKDSDSEPPNDQFMYDSMCVKHECDNDNYKFDKA